jgi:hypothetical protein
MLDKIKNIIYNSTNKINNNPILYGLTSIIEILIVLYIFYKWNPFDVRKKYPEIMQLFIIFLVFVQLLNFMFIKEKTNLASTGINIPANITDFTIKILITLTSILVVIFAVFFVIRTITTVDLFQKVFTWSVDSLIILSIISIIYLLLIPILNQGKDLNKKGILAFIGSLLLYIPCLFINFVDRVKKEIDITTNTTWIVLILLIVLVGLKTVLPTIFSKLILKNGITLLDKPERLNKQHTIGSFETLHNNNHRKKYEYSLSFWVWLNSVPPNTRKSYTKFTNILQFENNPSIKYNALENTLQFTSKLHNDKTVVLHEINNVPLQRWSNIVINYDKGTMDIFMNGVLVSSNPNIVPFLTNELITIGEEKGLEGNIMNITYFRKILSAQQINLSYNALKQFNLPIV